jgi:hypothetical protein
LRHAPVTLNEFEFEDEDTDESKAECTAAHVAAARQAVSKHEAEVEFEYEDGAGQKASAVRVQRLKSAAFGPAKLDVTIADAVVPREGAVSAVAVAATSDSQGDIING